MNSLRPKLLTNIKLLNFIYKKLIPDEYKKIYNATNLFHVELSNFFRMLYTMKGDKVEIVAFILDILDHPTYDKKFGYRKK